MKNQLNHIFAAIASFALSFLGFTQTTVTYSTPGTHTYIVPPCVTSITVQVWAGGGGGGGTASHMTSCFSCFYVEACSAGGGGGGGGFVSRTYNVTPGESYTVIVGAGGTAGPATNSTTATARDGGNGGNSSFSGPATIVPGTLLAIGGTGGRGARISNTSNFTEHLGANGLAGTGGAGSGHTTLRNGGNGATGRHSGSCWDLSGGGGGGGGTTANGNNAATLVCYGSVAGGTGGAAGGGNGGNGRAGNSTSSQYLAGNNATTLGGGAGGALIHLRDWFNSWQTRAGGVGARGEVRIIETPCPLPVELISFNGACVEDGLHFSWVTASERENDFFTLEYSADGSDFEAIQQIMGSGTTQEESSYSVHIGEDAFQKGYFALRQTDFNGQSRLYETIYLNCIDATNELLIFPNPAEDFIELILESNPNKTTEIIVQDILGRIVKQEFVVSDLNEGYRMSIEELEAGNFIVIVRNGAKEVSSRFTKIERPF
jgi:hypothetical protein